MTDDRIEYLAKIACEKTGGTWELCENKEVWRKIVQAVLEAINKVN
jgi:hypothetical protein